MSSNISSQSKTATADSKTKKTNGDSSLVAATADTDPSDVMGYQGLMTVTLKIDDYNGRYHDFQKRLMNSSSIFKNETEVNIFKKTFETKEMSFFLFKNDFFY